MAETAAFLAAIQIHATLQSSVNSIKLFQLWTTSIGRQWPKGSEQIDGWIAPVKERYGDRIAIEGIADVSTVPRLLRSMVRKQFKKDRAYPVMLDWDGPVTRSFNYQKG